MDSKLNIVVSSAKAVIGGGVSQSLPVVCFLGKDESTIKYGWLIGSASVPFDPPMPIAFAGQIYSNYYHTPFITMPVKWMMPLELVAPQFSIGYAVDGTTVFLYLYIQSTGASTQPLQLWQGQQSSLPANGFQLVLDTTAPENSQTCGISLIPAA